MTSPDALDAVRRAGARRRAIDDGTLPPDAPGDTPSDAGSSAHAAPEPTHHQRAPGDTHVPPQAVPDARADGSGVPGWGGPAAPPDAPVAGPGAGPAAGAAVAGGPWFDARAFFLGWVTMAAVAVAGAPTALIATAGFGAAYLLARRGKLKNALLSVGGAIVASILLLVAVLVIGLVASG